MRGDLGLYNTDYIYATIAYFITGYKSGKLNRAFLHQFFTPFFHVFFTSNFAHDFPT